MTTDELSDLIHAAFPVEPMPKKYWIEGIEPLGDIPRELASRIVYHPWIDVTILDWTMTGAPAKVARSYLDADAFRYYVPSLLVGSLYEPGYIDWPLECLLPANRKRRTKGTWWQAFWAGFSDQQKDAVRQYLTVVRSMLNPTELSSLHLIDETQDIWGV